MGSNAGLIIRSAQRVGDGRIAPDLQAGSGYGTNPAAHPYVPGLRSCLCAVREDQHRTALQFGPALTSAGGSQRRSTANRQQLLVPFGLAP